MKKLIWILLAGFVLFSTAVLSFGIYRYGSIQGIVRRVQIEVASRRPKEPIVIPTFVPEATVDPAAFVAGLATETATPTTEPTLTPIPTITPDSAANDIDPTVEPSPEPTVYYLV